MSDSALNRVIQYGTAAARAAFVPAPATGSKVLYIWFDSDASPATWVWNGAAWVQINASGVSGINQLTGDVTAGPGTGSVAATLANDAVVTAKILDAAVTYAKIQDVSAASKLLGRGDSGAGDVQELTLGTNLSITGTTLNAAGGGGASDWDTVITKTTDDSVTNSAVLVNDSEFQFSTDSAGAIWDIEVLLLYSANNNAADIKVGFAVAAGTMYGSFQAIHMNSTNTATTTTIPCNDLAATNAQIQGGTDQAGSDSKIHAMVIRGTFRSSNNTTFSLQFAQNTATPGSTTKTRIGSIMRRKKIL